MDAKAVLTAIEGVKPDWTLRREQPALPVSESAMAPFTPRELPYGRVPGPLAPEGIVMVREAAGLTQEQLALILGVEAPRVSQLERGKRPTNALEGDILCALLGALAPMVNAADAHAWGQSLARLAKEKGPLCAIMQILADGFTCRGVSR